MRALAVRTSRWKKFYWVVAWIGMAMLAGIPLAIYGFLKDWELLHLNHEMIWLYPLLFLGFGIFGMISGLAYWLIPAPTEDTK
jgi:hypothetical protein